MVYKKILTGLSGLFSLVFVRVIRGFFSRESVPMKVVRVVLHGLLTNI